MPWTSADEEEMRILEKEAEELNGIIKQEIANAATSNQPIPGSDLGSRLQSGVQTALEYSGALPVVRAAKSIGVEKKAPNILDALQLILTGATAGIGKAFGAPLSLIMKAGLGSSAASGVGKAALGPEAAQASQDILAKGGEKPSLARRIGAGIVSESPALLGGVVGPAAVGKTVGELAKVGQKISPRLAPFLEGIAQRAETGILPLSRAQELGNIRGIKAGELVPAEGLELARFIEKLLGVELTPYQTQFAATGKKATQTKIGDIERSLQKTGEAENIAQRQEDAFRSVFGQRLEKAAPGVTGKEAAEIGTEIQTTTRRVIESAKNRMRDIEEKIINSQVAQTSNKSFGKEIENKLAGFLKEKQANKGLRARIGKTEAGLIDRFAKEAKTINNLEEAINFKRRFGDEVDDAFRVLQGGDASRADFIKGQAYQLIDDAIVKASKTNRATSEFVKEYKAASLDYHNIKTEKFKDIKKVFGVESIDDLSRKDPEYLVKSLIDKGKTNIFPILKELSKDGVVDFNSIRRATASEILRRSVNPNTQKFDLTKMKNVWYDKISPDMKNVLFSKDAIKGVDEMVSVLEVLSSPQRYAFNPSGTAGALATAGRAAASVPIAGKLAYPIYGIQQAYKQGLGPLYYGAMRKNYLPKAIPKAIPKTLESILLGSKVSIPGIRENVFPELTEGGK